MSEKERAMSDIREALVARQREEYSASWDVLVPEVGWTLGRVVESTIEDVLAEFDVTPRGEGEQLFERDDSCGYCGRVHSDFAACFEDAPGAAWHDHEWQRRQNVTSRGYRMTPYEVCVVDGCDAARPVDEPAALTPATLPSVEDVARALAEHDGRLWSVMAEFDREQYRGYARAVLALLPGRTETEVKAEALREAADALDRDDMTADRWYAAWLRDHAERIARGEGS